MNASNSQGGVRKRGRRKSRLQKLAEYIKQAGRDNMQDLPDAKKVERKMAEYTKQAGKEKYATPIGIRKIQNK